MHNMLVTELQHWRPLIDGFTEANYAAECGIIDMEWCTIESDPAVFTELVEKYGVKGLQFEELYSVEDEELIQRLRPIHGLIFLFKWHRQTEPRESLEYYDNSLFFARQVIHNACATQAILSVLMNMPGLELGPQLREFKEFTAEFDPESRGLAIGNCEFIRTNHNSFAQRNIYIEPEKPSKGKKEDVFHFVSYIPFKGTVYELDGLQKGPIVIGPCGDNWVKVGAQAVRKRIESYSAKEVHFNLLAVVDSQIERLRSLIAKQEEGADKQSEEASAASKARLEQLREKLAYEEGKREKDLRENQRRKHNYTPLIIEALKVAARSGKLPELLARARARLGEKMK